MARSLPELLRLSSWLKRAWWVSAWPWLILAFFALIVLIQDTSSFVKRERLLTEQWAQNIAVLLSRHQLHIPPPLNDRHSEWLSQLEADVLELRDTMQIIGNLRVKVLDPQGLIANVSSSPQSEPLAEGWGLEKGRLMLTTISAATNGTYRFVVALERDATSLFIQGSTFLLSLFVFLIALALLFSHRPRSPRQNLPENPAKDLLLQALSAENHELQRQALTDSLTGCYNRKFLDSLLSPLQLQILAFEGCSMLLIDIDRFKAINDDHGHLIGDKVLRKVGETMRGFFRRSDKVLRYGGDEFVVLLHATTLEAAKTVAGNFVERARSDLAHLLADRSLTFSIGIAEIDIGESGEKWMSRADRALYRSKQTGRSRVMVDDLNQLEILN